MLNKHEIQIYSWEEMECWVHALLKSIIKWNFLEFLKSADIHYLIWSL